MGEKVIFLGVSGVATALTALVTFRADRRMPSRNFHCRFLARKNSTAMVAGSTSQVSLGPSTGRALINNGKKQHRGKITYCLAPPPN